MIRSNTAIKAAEALAAATAAAEQAAPAPVPAPALPATPDAAPIPWATLRSKAMVVIAVLLCIFAAREASVVLVPIVFSILAGLTLAPLVRMLVALHIHRGVASMVVVVAALACAVGLFSALRDPAQEWVERIPVAMERLEQRLQEFRRPLRAASKATETLMNLGENDPSRSAVRVVAQAPNPLADVLKQVPAIVTSMVVSIFLVFLLLLHGEDVLRKLVVLMPRLSAKKEFVAGTREVQTELSRYLLTIMVINIGLGLATAAGLFAIGFPDPLLWAGVIALLNFAPYVGPAVSALLLLLAGFGDHHSSLQVAAAPGIFLTLHALESQLITPHLVGRQLALDPVVIFIALLLFGWLWGITGLLMAVPILACLKVVANRVPGGETWAFLLVQ